MLISVSNHIRATSSNFLTIVLAPIFKIRKETQPPLKTVKSEVLLKAFCQLVMAACSDRDFFSSNFSQFAIKYDWNSKNLAFLKKNIDEFLRKKLRIFFKIAKGGKFAVECVSNDNFWWKCLFHLNCEVF